MTLPIFTPYLAALRTGQPAGEPLCPVRFLRGLAEPTVAVRPTAVLSFCRYHRDVHGAPVADRLYRAGRRSGRYLPGLVHPRSGPAVKLRAAAQRPVPVLTRRRLGQSSTSARRGIRTPDRRLACRAGRHPGSSRWPRGRDYPPGARPGPASCVG